MQVTRRRRLPKDRRVGRRMFLVTAGATAVVVTAGTGMASAQTHQFGTDQVGQTTARGLVVSDDQYVDSIGKRLVINNGKSCRPRSARTAPTSRPLSPTAGWRWPSWI